MRERDTLIIDGKSLADQSLADTRKKISILSTQVSRSPSLVLVQVGEQSDSSKYLRKKEELATSLGIKVIRRNLASDITQDELNELLCSLSSDSSVDTILLQLPLPPQISTEQALDLIAPEKDIDALHPFHVSALANQSDRTEKCDSGTYVPPTAAGVLELINFAAETLYGKRSLSGLNALVLGRSNLVGIPTAHLLLKCNVTVSVAHSYSDAKSVERLAKDADIIVSAVGKAGIVRGSMIRNGAILIDVGISFNSIGKISGDMEFESCCERAGAITPVPGGVGPMTLAMLMKNVFLAADFQYKNRKNLLTQEKGKLLHE